MMWALAPSRAALARSTAILLLSALAWNNASGEQPASVAGANPESPAPREMIDLPTALKLAGMNDIDLALVREAESLAKAANDAATLRFFPWLNVQGAPRGASA